MKVPRSAPSNVATGTTTYLGQWVIPCGESTDAVQVSLKLPTLTQAFASGITSIAINFTVYVIPSVNPATVAFVESPLPPYGASAVVPVEQYQPTNIAPDFVDLVGQLPTALQSIAAYDTSGREVVNALDSTTIQMSQYGSAGRRLLLGLDVRQPQGEPGLAPGRHPRGQLDARCAVDPAHQPALRGADRRARPDPESPGDLQGRDLGGRNGRRRPGEGLHGRAEQPGRDVQGAPVGVPR